MIGLDEVGRGSWAGPLLVVAARAKGSLPSGLKDSKLMTKAQREAAVDALTDRCQFGEGWVDASEIDCLGLTGAQQLGAKRALEALKVAFDEEIILDGKYNYISPSYTAVKCQIDADATVALVSAASIYAKVARDKLMTGLAKDHPGYGFDRHVGYGTALHRSAIAAHGVIEGIHRLSFKPVASMAA